MASASSSASASGSLTNDKWVLRARPSGVFSSAECCGAMEHEEVDVSSLAPDEIVVRVETLSVDAFLRTMLDADAYHGSVTLGATMPAMGIGVVVAAGRDAKLGVGKKVLGMLGAQTVARLTPGPMGPMALMKLPGVPESASLGLLGLTTGLTAWVGMFRVAPRSPRAGETVLVTAAAGAVGSLAAQLALTTGARVIGVAGGASKCGGGGSDD